MQNRAIAQASGEILVFLDDDLVVAEGYLEAVEQFFDKHREFAAMKGRILPAEDPEKKVGPMAVYLDLPIADHGEEVVEVRGVLGANMAFRANALSKSDRSTSVSVPARAGTRKKPRCLSECVARAFESDTRPRRWYITKSTRRARIATDSSESRANAAMPDAA